MNAHDHAVTRRRRSGRPYILNPPHLDKRFWCLLLPFALVGALAVGLSEASWATDVGHEVVVKTRQGIVEGDQTAAVQVFRGIPFAAAPTGPLRFRPPAAPTPWSGVRPAHQFERECVQPNASPTVYSEDCLYLNVWTPGADSGHRPVMVWIHGGAFTTGSDRSPLYDGGELAHRGDVIVVSAQYRLGLLGFLDLSSVAGPTFRGSANLGFLDQIAALKWVRRNIGAFGGDPSNVTIFGESAGGTSVYGLLGAPGAAGLFQKAIMESGAPVEFISHSAAQQLGQEVMTLAHAKTAEDLQSLGIADILKIQATVYRGQSACPSYDGVVFTRAPIDMIKRGSGVPLIVGTALDELGRGGPIDGPAPAPLYRMYDPLIGMSEDELRQRLEIALASRVRASTIIDEYIQHYPSLSEAVGRMRGDIIYRIPSIGIAEANSSHRSTYMYLFAARAHVKAPDGSALDVALHMAEIPFVFDKDAPLVTGSVRDKTRLTHQVISAWTNFARTGDPNGPGLPFWLTYGPTRRATMWFDVHASQLVDDPDASDRRAWAQVPFRTITSIDAQEWFLHDLASVQNDFDRRHQ